MLAGLENKCQMRSVLSLSGVSFQLSFIFVNFISFPAVPLPALSALAIDLRDVGPSLLQRLLHVSALLRAGFLFPSRTGPCVL